MVELIAIIVFISSLVGIGIILYRKMPVLVELPETPAEFNLRENFLKLKRKIKSSRYFSSISLEIFLQKVLSKVRVLTLKADNKTGSWLQKLREESQRKKEKENDNYWQEIKKSTKK